MLEPEGHYAAGSCVVEVALPLRLSAKWVAYACRTAGVAKPKWSPIRETWTTSTKGADGIEESIAITAWGESGIRVKVEWRSPDGAERDTPTARRIITAVVTAMQWQVRRRVVAAPDSQLHLR
jgi:hypothetical protein